MSNKFKNFSNIRTLRAIARETSLSQLELLLQKLTQVIEEKKEEVAKQEAKHQKYLENLNKYKQMLEQDGINPEDLVTALQPTIKNKQRKTTKLRPAKYKYIDENGNEKKWTGQGRTPKIIQKALDKGQSLSEFKI
ncbi:H-NS family nucleoid-associated regulatory protein [Pasteurella atlantica]|uniref:H-NS family nucleoid-associated regulatory protein n=3 Tax=Pasteurellaceae TaxID=712 RepID=A0ACC6HJA1_9PAST|nr:H-NS family nucleoid-associated regulatory protein [Pasteurella atlantica]MBR0573963.1 H-NS histone family protein [Pasteurella atlantica]MDP8033846.1 H-NS family nucleoid-associated regulatory protein [Pasteurella atlantica]MDP8035781.1 H-NS family nucleoid-associated regulatory protein [Pasteurella atlantica]MDP8037684.1 H-NS family nucleoid-associated regulatory protein [Pasteurella atlantica]MDP8039894.1 H-NS family nucleoid-associated regulatory protein [Pasteurella atlantica]